MSDPITDTPAPEPSGQEALNALTPEARRQWELTGDWPDPAKTTTTAPTPPAVVAEDADDDEPAVPPAPPVEATPAAEPAKPISKRQQQINDLIRRSTEAELRAKDLEGKLAALEGKVTPTEPDPAPAPIVDPSDPEPQEAAFETYGAYVKAQAKWEVRQAKREADAAAAKAQQAQMATVEHEAFETKAKAWIARRDAFTAAHPEKTDQLMAFLETVHARTPIGDVLLESEVGADVADYLATHRDEAERIARLAPISALRALGKLEALFDRSLTSASASAGPAAKTVTTAPAPPPTLAARSADPADPLEAALASKDFRAFEAEANKRELAARR